MDKKKPLLEGGAGAVSALVPAYPGSEDTNFFFIPFPTFFYRGDVLRADEEGGMRGRFFKNDRLEVNLSIGGSLPASSKDVSIRDGMPDLNTMVEFGPGVLATLWQKRGPISFKLGLNLPLRNAWSVDFFEAKERGLVFNPLLYFITEGLLAKGYLTFTSLSSVFATQKFHRVFYAVDPQFQTAVRPSYQAQSGYLGTTLAQGFSKQVYKDVLMFLGFGYQNFKGAANRNSPLLRREENFSAALGIVWWFWESDSLEN